MRATITYSKVTPESAEHGDVSEHGWYLPGGWYYPLEDDNGYHEDILEDVQKNPSAYCVADTVADLVSVAEDMGFYNEGSDWLTTEPHRDYATDEDTTYNLHIEDVTPATYGRILRLIGV